MLSQFRDFWKKTFCVLNYDQSIPPSAPMGKWKEIPVDKSGTAFSEPLVPMGLFTEQYPDTYCPEIFTDAIYYGERDTSLYKVGLLEGALITSFVRKGVAKRLALASKMLPEGHAFLLLDTLRTEQVQRSLFERYKNTLMDEPHSLSEAEAVEQTQNYVSQPSRENSPHVTGGAVDLTIVRFAPEDWRVMKALTKKLREIASDKEQWKEVYELEMQRHQLLREKGKILNMGVAFDEVAEDEQGIPKTALRYYEEKLEREGRLSFEEMEPLKNRRLLYNVMSAVGFTFYPEEPWHADYGNKFWAERTGSTAALYGYAAPSVKNMEHEKVRRGHHSGSVKLNAQLNAPADGGKGSSLLMSFVHAAARMYGSLSRSERQLERHEVAHIISPPDGLTRS